MNLGMGRIIEKPQKDAGEEGKEKGGEGQKEEEKDKGDGRTIKGKETRKRRSLPYPSLHTYPSKDRIIID